LRYSGAGCLRPSDSTTTQLRCSRDSSLPPDATGGIIRPLPKGLGYTIENMTAKIMMAAMYSIPERQIEGGPEWFGTQRFNVEARADRRGYSIGELHTMFRNLLRDRFDLKIHIDTREGPFIF
jgi:uncharacterized protein (TIGR03435 family)